jgi:hypothetical protein
VGRRNIGRLRIGDAEGALELVRLLATTVLAWVRPRHDLGTLCRECLDHLIVLDEHHLSLVLREFVGYHNRERPHRTLGLQTPETTLRPATGPFRSHPILNGLHHVYQRAA